MFCGENYDASRVMNCNNKPRNDYNHTWFAVGVLLFGDEWYSFMFILMDEMAISLLVIFGAVKDESAAEATQESVVGDTDTDATTQTETETGNQDGILSINVFDYLIQFDAQTLQRFGRVKDEFAAGLRNDTKGEHWAQDMETTVRMELTNHMEPKYYLCVVEHMKQYMVGICDCMRTE
eukprot:1026284_1